MKNKIRLLITAGLCSAMVLGVTACGSEPKEIGSSQGAQAGTDSQTSSASGYVFTYNGTTIAADADMAPIAEALGEPANYYEEPSCAAQGISKIYNYSDFEVYTYPDGDNDLVQTVILKTDNVATPEEIDLSKEKSDIIAAYGEDYEEANGQMVYKKDGMKLCFIMDGDSILSIEYNSGVLD